MMKNPRKNVLIAALIVTFTVVGCAQKAKSPDEAIEVSKTKANVEAQVNYLIGQANSFINSDEFDEAITIARYVLRNLDSKSEAAEGIIEKAQAELKKLASQKMEEVKGKLGAIGQ